MSGTDVDAGDADAVDTEGGTVTGGGTGIVGVGTGVGSTGTGNASGVYVVAQLKSTSTYVIAPVSAPNQYSYGIDSLTQIGIRGPNVIYIQNGVLKVFKPDLDSAPDPEGYTFPDTGKNDVTVNTAPCTAVGTFLTNTASRLIYQCAQATPWYESGRLVYDGQYNLLSLGANSLALVYNGSIESGLVTLTDGSFTQCGDLSERIAVRTRGSGFDVAATTTAGASLYNVIPDGSSSLRGVYPPAAGSFAPKRAVLGADDALYELGKVDSEATIMRFQTGAQAVTVYTEKADDFIDWSSAFLMTGP